MVLIFEYKQILIEGAFVTITLAIASLLLSVFFGLLGAFAKLSASSVARRTGNVYTTFVRSVPDLVLMMLIFFWGSGAGQSVGLCHRALGICRNQPIPSWCPHAWLHFRGLYVRNLSRCHSGSSARTDRGGNVGKRWSQDFDQFAALLR
jgi:His/Glu/Gln/Arg/opine family amino acid ABC transporter permease subunit